MPAILEIGRRGPLTPLARRGYRGPAGGRTVVAVRRRRSFDDDEEGLVDGPELVAWCAVALLLTAPLLLRFSFARRALATFGEWLLDELTAEPEVDVDALDLYHALRRQRLLEHVARLRRILADDSHQSAVRQLGNRLAYRQLLQELAEVGEAARALPLRSDAEQAWAPVVALAGRGGAGLGGTAAPYAPRVEVLDFGRRPRRS